jgi:hypothetical protein
LTERGQRRLLIALPWLKPGHGAGAPSRAAPARSPAVEWLVARGTVDVRDDKSWRQWLADEAGAGRDSLQQFPAGPCLRALEPVSSPGVTWACARPVHLLTAIDHLQLATGDLSLDGAESNGLLGDINRHLDGRGFRFYVTHSGPDWLLECAAAIECSCIEPEAAEGRNLRDTMPAGRDGASMRSLMNEIQMLLHEHPVNEARVARRLPAVNSLWLWGFGRTAQAHPMSLPGLRTDDAWLRGFWRMHGAHASPLPEHGLLDPGATADGIVAWSHTPANGEVDALARAEAQLFAPAMARLGDGSLQQIVMRLGDRTIRVDRRARFRFWRRPRPLHEVLD